MDVFIIFFFFSSRRRHTRWNCDWSSDVCSSDLDDTVSRIDASTGRISTIPLAGRPGGIAVGAGGVWVADQTSDQLLLIDPGSDQVTQAQEIGGDPAGVAVGAGDVWVANTPERTVSRF